MDFSDPYFNLTPFKPRDVEISNWRFARPGPKTPFSLYTVRNGQIERLDYFTQPDGPKQFYNCLVLELANNDGSYLHAEVLTDGMGNFYFLDPRPGPQNMQAVPISDENRKYARPVVVTYNHFVLSDNFHSKVPQSDSIVQQLSDQDLRLRVLENQVCRLGSQFYGNIPFYQGQNPILFASNPESQKNLNFNGEEEEFDLDSNSSEVNFQPRFTNNGNKSLITPKLGSLNLEADKFTDSGPYNVAKQKGSDSPYALGLVSRNRPKKSIYQSRYQSYPRVHESGGLPTSSSSSNIPEVASKFNRKYDSKIRSSESNQKSNSNRNFSRQPLSGNHSSSDLNSYLSQNTKFGDNKDGRGLNSNSVSFQDNFASSSTSKLSSEDIFDPSKFVSENDLTHFTEQPLLSYLNDPNLDATKEVTNLERGKGTNETNDVTGEVLEVLNNAEDSEA